jgi:hypothetical protein
LRGFDWARFSAVSARGVLAGSSKLDGLRDSWQVNVRATLISEIRLRILQALILPDWHRVPSPKRSLRLGKQRVTFFESGRQKPAICQ